MKVIILLAYLYFAYYSFVSIYSKAMKTNDMAEGVMLLVWEGIVMAIGVYVISLFKNKNQIK